MNIAIILAGGVGKRLGMDIPKQYIEINGKPIIGYCLERFINSASIDAIQIVAEKQWHDMINKCIESLLKRNKIHGFSVPGTNRQMSVYNALLDVMKYARNDDYVMIHDAARPLIREEFIERCFRQIIGHDGILPVIPMKDTVYYSEDGNSVSMLLKRETIFAGQAPEVFVLGKYLEANRVLLPNKILLINGSTEPAVMAGMDIQLISGDEENFKVTTKEDLRRLEQILKQ